MCVWCVCVCVCSVRVCVWCVPLALGSVLKSVCVCVRVCEQREGAVGRTHRHPRRIIPVWRALGLLVLNLDRGQERTGPAPKFLESRGESNIPRNETHCRSSETTVTVRSAVLDNTARSVRDDPGASGPEVQTPAITRHPTRCPAQLDLPSTAHQAASPRVRHVTLRLPRQTTSC